LTSISPHPNELRRAESRLDCEGEQRVITAADPGRLVWRGEQGPDLWLGEKRDEAPLEPLRRDREDTLDHGRVLRMTQGGVAEQRPNRDQSGITGGNTVAAVVFAMIEKPTDERRVEIGHIQLRRFRAEPLSRKAHQQPPGVSVSGHGVGAGLTL